MSSSAMPSVKRRASFRPSGWSRVRRRFWKRRRTANSGKHPKTLNEHLSYMRAFLGWLVALGRIVANPLADVGNLPTRGRSSDRRALSCDEVQRLLAVDRPFRGLYALGLATGLRRSELAALLWADVQIDVKRSRVLVDASTTKNDKRGHVLAARGRGGPAEGSAWITRQCGGSCVPAHADDDPVPRRSGAGGD